MLKITSELSEVIKRAKKEHPYASFQQLSQILQKKYNVKYSFNSLRRAISFVLNSPKEVEIDVDFENDEFDIVLPDSRAIDRPPYILAEGNKRILVLNDIHLPYHDNRALKVALKSGYEFGIDTIILNGDIIDFYSISRFARDPNQRDIYEELKLCESFLSQLAAKFPNTKIIFKEGNHEKRLRTYRYEKAPELANIPEFALPSLLHFQKYQIDFVDAWTVIQIGKLNVIHGHEILGGGIIVARTHFLKALDNILFGHFHRHQDYTQRTIKDHVMGSWAVGCLSHLKPDYYPVNNFTHGFALIDRSDDGTFEILNKEIINGYVK